MFVRQKTEYLDPSEQKGLDTVKKGVSQPYLGMKDIYVKFNTGNWIKLTTAAVLKKVLWFLKYQKFFFKYKKIIRVLFLNI